MLSVNLAKVVATLSNMVIVCTDRIGDLGLEMNKSYTILSAWQIEEYTEKIKHYKLLKQDAEEAIKLCDSYLT